MLLGLVFCLCGFLPAVSCSDPDENRDALQLITSKGYAGQEHVVTTDDGYKLRVQRIPCRLSEAGTENCTTPRPVVMLQHGLLSSSASWLMNLRNESLGYILADAGFDVWLGNMRGNIYGLKHVKYTTKDHRFWDFSFDEMAGHDLPSMVNYILSYTGQPQLSYIGHSQGTMIGFAQFSRDESLSAKVKHFYALAPVAYVGNIEGPLKVLAPKLVKLEYLGSNKFLVDNRTAEDLQVKFCGSRIGNPLCACMDYLIFGFDSSRLNTTRIPVYKAHGSAGTSTKNIAHFGQLVSSGYFRRYDYGPAMNIWKYGRLFPPAYQTHKITVPTSVYYGLRDQLSDPTDVIKLLPHLYSVVDIQTMVPYNHIDFVIGLNVNVEMYPKIVASLKGDFGIE